MKYKMLSVYDSKAEAFGQPFFTLNFGSAIRSFEDECMRPAENNVMFRHPEDYSLYSLGTFEDSNATFEAHMPQLLIQGSQVIAKKEALNA